MVCSASAAATLMALTSSRGQRTCNGTGFGCSGFFLFPPLSVVAAVGLVVVERTRASRVRAVGLAIGAYLSTTVPCLHALRHSWLHATMPENSAEGRRFQWRLAPLGRFRWPCTRRPWRRENRDSNPCAGLPPHTKRVIGDVPSSLHESSSPPPKIARLQPRSHNFQQNRLNPPNHLQGFPPSSRQLTCYLCGRWNLERKPIARTDD
jgi:hypothetical protein